MYNIPDILENCKFLVIKGDRFKKMNVENDLDRFIARYGLDNALPSLEIMCES
jgi:hypothetical protein